MWLPGFERMPISGRPGVPYDEYDDPKAMWHSTQGTSIAGAVQAYAPYPPHLIADPRAKRKGQHIDLDYAAYALWNEDVDDSRCVQIEVVGYAEDAKHWPDEYYRWLGEEVARPLHEHFGVPYVAVWKGFKGPEDVDYILASASSPLRLTQWEIDHFSGHLAHQHSPGDSHWDAPFLMDKLLGYARRASETPEQIIKKRGQKMFSIEVTSEPIPANDSRLTGTTVAGTGIDTGFTLLVDVVNRLNIGMGDAASLRVGSKDAHIPHYGVSGPVALDILKKYTVAP